MAEVIRYVDPDASGAGDGTSWTDAYTSLSAWNTGEATDLVTDGDWHHVYCRSSAGSADTTAVDIDGWTTGADNYILIEAADGDEAVKDEWDTSRYRLDLDVDSYHSTYALNIDITHITVDGIQLTYSSRYSGTGYATLNVTSDGTGVLIKNCRAKRGTAANETKTIVGFTNYAYSATTKFENCIAEDFEYGFVGNNDFSSGDPQRFYNCLAHNCENGFSCMRRGDLDTINCAAFNCTDDFVSSGTGTHTIDHCASDDGDGTNSVSPSGSDWDNEFNDPDNGDFTLLNSGNCYQGGTTITGGPTYDIDGDEWDASTPSIGVDEYEGGGGGVTIPIMMHHYMTMRA